MATTTTHERCELCNAHTPRPTPTRYGQACRTCARTIHADDTRGLGGTVVIR